MKLSEDLNDGVEWVFRDYGISLKQSKDPLPPRDDVMESILTKHIPVFCDYLFDLVL